MLSLRVRVLGPALVAASLVVAVFILGIHRDEAGHLKAEVDRNIQSIDRQYRSALEERADKLGAALLALQQDTVLRSALVAGDRAALLARSAPLFESLKSRYNITHFYFHDSRRVNLLRVHQPERFGDTIDRLTAREAERSGTLCHGVELGPLGTFTLRVVLPVREDGRLLGYVELGEDVNQLIRDIHHRMGADYLLVLDKRQLQREGWKSGQAMLEREAKWTRYPGSVLVDQTMDAIPSGLDSRLSRPDGLSAGEDLDLTWGERHYRGQALPLVDVGGQRVGYMVALLDNTARIQGTRRTIAILGLVALGVGASLLLLFYVILGRAEKQLADSQRDIRESRDGLARAQQMAHLGNWEWQPAGDQLTCSDEAAAMLGLPPDGAPYRIEALLARLHPDDREVFTLALEKARTVDGFQVLEHRILGADGSERIVSHQMQAAHGEAGKVTGINAILRDISEERRNQILSGRLGRILEHSWNEIYVFDARTLRFTQVSEGALRNLGYSLEEIQALTPLDLKPGLSRDEFEALLGPLRRGEETHASFESWHQRKDGSLYPVEIRLHFSAAEPPPVFVAILQDISERQRYIAELEHKALYDSLTELPNRALLMDRLAHAIDEVRRLDKPLALAVLDVNRLREVNDILGHQAGDRVLQAVAERLRGLLRASDSIARLGGDEFALVLPDVGTDQTAAVARKLQTLFEEAVLVEDIPLEIEASLGIALYPEHGDQPATLLQHADVALRFAKNEKASFILYRPEEDPYSLRRLRLMGELRHAVQQRELALYYQPKLDLKSGRICGVEALARWPHPTDGMIQPGEFIPLVEQSGLIHSFTLWALEQATKQSRDWRNAGLDLKVAVNLSVRNLLTPGLAEEVARLIEDYALPATSLILEITESTIMTRPEVAMRVLTSLDELGVDLSIDDFGTGYSSLSYLTQLPVDELKIDARFVKNMIGNESDAVIVRSTIDLAHNLGLKVVAEGVEDQDVMDMLTILGCDVAQGYFLSRPISADDFRTWLADSLWPPQQI